MSIYIHIIHIIHTSTNVHFRYLPEGVSDPTSLNVLELNLQGPCKDLPPGLPVGHSRKCVYFFKVR